MLQVMDATGDQQPMVQGLSFIHHASKTLHTLSDLHCMDANNRCLELLWEVSVLTCDESHYYELVLDCTFVHSSSCSSCSKIESNLMGISPSLIDRFSASRSSSVRCGGFSIHLMRRCAAAFFPFSVFPFTLLAL